MSETGERQNVLQLLHDSYHFSYNYMVIQIISTGVLMRALKSTLMDFAGTVAHMSYFIVVSTEESCGVEEIEK